MIERLNDQAERYLASNGSAMHRGKARAVLARNMTFNGQGLATRADHAVRLHAAGYRLQRTPNHTRRLMAPDGASFFEEAAITSAMCNFMRWLEEQT